jgi:ribonuclease BN (tRNA processing enzyme)
VSDASGRERRERTPPSKGPGPEAGAAPPAARTGKAQKLEAVFPGEAKLSGFSFLPLGVGDAFSALYYSFCVLLEAEGRRLLVDCPHPIRKILREAGAVDLDAIDGVILTHLHADHSSGLEGYGYFSFFALGRRAQLAAHPEVVARLWDGHLAAGMEHLMSAQDLACHAKSFGDYFELRPLAYEHAVELSPFSIECRRTIHHIPTTALRIRAAGRTLGISADTAFDPGLLEWLAEADLIIHETNYGVHTPYERLAALPAELRGKMRLIHYPDDFDLEHSAIEPLRQGRVVQI